MREMKFPSHELIMRQQLLPYAALLPQLRLIELIYRSSFGLHWKVVAAAVAQAIMIDSASHICACVHVCVQYVRSRSALSILFRFVIRACVQSSTN